MKKTLTLAIILSLLNAAPRGFAQEQTLSGPQSSRITLTESADVYISGDVVFADMTSSDSVGGAAIGVGTSSMNAEPILVRIMGLNDGKTDNLSFINNAIENKWNLGGAVGTKDMTYPITIAFENLNSLTFDNNRIEGGLYNQPCGGGSIGAQTMIFKNINSVSITGGYDGTSHVDGEFSTEEISATFGGALRGYTLIVDHVGDFSVRNVLTYGNSSGNGAISIGKTGQAPSVISNCDSVEISNNALIYNGGFVDYTAGSAIEVGRNNLSLFGNGSIRIADNYGSYRATVYIYENNDGYQGRFECYLNGGFEVSGNSSEEYLPGIQMLLVNPNSGSTDPEKSSNGRIMLSADYGDIVFRNNIGCLNNLPFKFATAISYHGNLSANHLTAGDFRAMKGQSIHFYDPIHVWSNSTADGDVLNITFNKSPQADDPRNAEVIENYNQYMGGVPDFEGTIHFSGEYYLSSNSPYLQQEDGESADEFALRLLYSRWSDVVADTELWNGELLIEHGAVFGNGDDTLNCGDFVYKNGNLTLSEEAPNGTWKFAEETSLTIQKGALALRSEGIAIAKNINFSGFDAVLRTDHTARIIADRVDMSKGMSVDFNHSLQYGLLSEATAVSTGKNHYLVTAPLTITANSLTMGTSFTLGVADHTTATPGAFYSDDAWKSDLTFVVFDASMVSDKSALAQELSIVSVASLDADSATGTHVVEYDGGSHGEWSLHWGDSEDGDDQYVLYAEWRNTDPNESGDSGHITVAPERVGFVVENTLWSTKGNAEQLQNAAMAQVTGWRFEDHRATRLWGSALGEFERVHSKDGHDGYNYNGGGYSVGMDRMWEKRYLAGVGFGQMFGKNSSRSYPDSVDQDSIMATVYGAAKTRLSDESDLVYSISLTYGWTDNALQSWQQASHTTYGNWDSEALLVKLNAQWNRRLSERSSLGIALGLEYGHASRDAFTESGADGRHFDDSSLSVLSMPVSGSWSYEGGLLQKPWVNTLYVSYVPDLYRDNPRSTARDSGGWWDVRGVEPGRHALRLGYSTQWAVSGSCTLYAGYNFEYRDTASYHHLNAGVSIGF